MHTIWVTGPSGAGKSAVSRRLALLGHEAVSTDSVDGLCHWVDGHGHSVERPADPDLAWLATHQWCWRPARLDQLIEGTRSRGASVLFLCGDAANAPALSAGRFDRTVLLRINLDTMLAGWPIPPGVTTSVAPGRAATI